MIIQHHGFILREEPRPLDPVITLVWIGLLTANFSILAAIYQVLA